MSSDKKAKYRNLIYRLESAANNIGGSVETVNKIPPELDKGILINGEGIEQQIFVSTNKYLKDAQGYLYNAINSCYNSMYNEEED